MKLTKKPLPRSFFSRPTLTVARELLGALLVRQDDSTRFVARIVETEAYVGEKDKACHAACGRTQRNHVMYGAPGYAYVYFTYGMHHCLNAVTEKNGFPAAVLLRAAEPLNEIERLRARRAGRKDHELLGGPGRLCAGFRIDREMNGIDLTLRRSQIYFCLGEPVGDDAVETTTRVGISKSAGEDRFLPWRFLVRGNSFVSKGRVATRATT